MRRRASLNDNVGGGIFEEEENNNYARAPSLSHNLSSDVKARVEEGVETEVEPEVSAQQVLDCLDRQIKLLDETKRINKYQHEERNCKRNFIAANEDSIATAAAAPFKYWIHRRHSDLEVSNSSRLRKLALDRYLRQTLKSTGECGCHFRHNNLSNEDLYGDLSDSRLGNHQSGKLKSHIAGSSLQNYYLVEENSHPSATEANPSHGVTTLHTNNRSLVDSPFQRQQQYLPKLKPTTSAEQLSHGLLIDESGEDCASGAVTAAGAGRGKAPAAGKPPTGAGSQSASRQGLTEATDWEFYDNRSANFKAPLATCRTNHSSSPGCAIAGAVGYEWDCEEEFESEVGSALAGLHDDDDHDDDHEEKEEDISGQEGVVEEANYTKTASLLCKVISPQTASCQCQTYCSLTDSSTFSLSWAQDNPLSNLEIHLNSNLKSSDTVTKSSSSSSRQFMLEEAPPGGSSISGRSYLCNKRTGCKLIREPNDDDERWPEAGSISSSILELGHYNCSYSLDDFPTASPLSMNEASEINIDAGNSNFNNSRDTNCKTKYRSLSVEQQQGERSNYNSHVNDSSSKLAGRIGEVRGRSTLIAFGRSSESGSELLSHSPLLLSSSDNDGEETIPKGGKRKRRSQPIGKAEKSMRAAKDIAKLSIPSLSSLQYLPSHLDANTRKNLQRRRKRIRERNTNNRSYKMAPRITASNEINNKNLTNVVAGAESCENIHHEHQGLLTRLCMSCNCATKASDLQQTEKAEKKRSRKSASECQLNENRGTDLVRSQKSPSKSEKLRPSSSSGSAEATKSENEMIHTRKSRSAAEKQQFNKPIEKQSPSFLSILKSSSIGQKLELRTVEKADARQNRGFVAHANVISHSADEDEDDEDEDVDGELDLDLASDSSQNHSSESRSHSLAPGPQRSSVERQRQQRQRRRHQQQQQSSTSCDSPPPTPDGSSSQLSRPQSVCTDRESVKGTKSSSTLRRYLTPTRFFSSSPSSKSGLSSYHDANLDKRRISSPTAELKKDLSGSFFTRSLNRFSGRKKEQKKQLDLTVDDKLTAKTGSSEKSPLSSDSHLKNHSSCASPTISNLSSLHNDSLRSLDQDIELPPFPQVPQLKQKNFTSGKPVLLAPEIILSRVEYSANLNSSGDAGRHMGRPSNKHQRHLSNIELDNHGASHDYNYLADSANPLRYGSDNGNGDLSISDGSSERAMSLPSSPYRARRQGSPGASSRSPRLTHSPVPFQSPITQSTKIEDGLQVCSSEHFEKHIGNIKGGQLEAQKKLFKAWINHYSPHLIQHDLVDELRDGIKLIGLLASLTRDRKLLVQYEKLNRDKQSLINRLAVTPTSRLKHLSNVSIAIDYLREQMGMKLINLNPMDVVSGRPNVILGLCWNIILRFQLEQNFLRYLDSCETSSLSSSIECGQTGGSTSRLSASSTNEDSVAMTKSLYRGSLADQMEEFTFNDLAKAKRKLLEHINQRFNLKLTHLTSSLLDGDALLAIIKQLLKPEEQLPEGFEANFWSKKNNDAKLDACFELAQERLNVPRLFSALDLRQQSISDNTSKPLLVYLSMLVNANRSATSSFKEEPPLSQLTTVPPEQDHNIEVSIRGCLEQVNKPDSFSLSNLQSTLVKIKELEKLLASHKDNAENIPPLDPTLLINCQRVANDANRVESLISWINKADSLFDKTQKSSDLNKSLEEYRNFFSAQHVPDVKRLSLCPTLERQYRECLNTAKQRVLSMEQTLKNREGYERAKRLLKDWLTTAESKLIGALQPIQSIPEANVYDPLQHHKACLEDLIEYFELEPIDSILTNELYAQERELDSNMFQNDDSLSNMGSILSLNSNSSRLSSLQSSRKATYYGLFDDFELKSRLLATQLDANQKDALMMGARELKHRLRHITEQRVPQVVNELRFNIVRTDMFIKDDQDLTLASTEQLNDEDEGELEDISGCLLPSDNDQEEELANESSLPTQDLEQMAGEMQTISKSSSIEKIKTNEESNQNKKSESKSVKSVTKTQKSHDAEKVSDLLNREQRVCESKPLVSWSLLNWLFSSDSDAKLVVTKQTKGSKRNRRLAKSQKSRALKSPSRSSTKKLQSNTGDKSETQVDNSNDGEAIPFARMFWYKLIRASKASMSLNIVLLICLAGICVVPLINKDACCELSHTRISADEFSMHEKPT